jgi:hypothetical protein
MHWEKARDCEEDVPPVPLATAAVVVVDPSTLGVLGPPHAASASEAVATRLTGPHDRQRVENHLRVTVATELTPLENC